MIGVPPIWPAPPRPYRFARAGLAGVIAVTLAFTLSACAADAHAGGLSCDTVVSDDAEADLFGGSGHFVQVTSAGEEPADPLVSTIAENGIACAASADRSNAVIVGWMPMDDAQWAWTQNELAGRGYERNDDAEIDGLLIARPDPDGPSGPSGFAWRNGVLYYTNFVLFLGYFPAFSADFAGFGDD